MNWIKRNFVTIILVGILAIGTGLIAYPTFADWWNSFHQSRAVASYATAVSDLDTKEYDRILKEAEDYNKELAKTGTVWKMDDKQEKKYRKTLAIDSSGIMGYEML